VAAEYTTLTLALPGTPAPQADAAQASASTPATRATRRQLNRMLLTIGTKMARSGQLAHG